MFQNSLSYSVIETVKVPKVRGNLIFVILFLIHSWVLTAQEITVNGGFIEDSLKIGENVNYWLTAHYPYQLELTFPDSTTTYDPFELIDKTYFPTKLISGMAYDSAIYTFQSFEIDEVQYLSLAALVLRGQDTTQISAPKDSIYLIELVPFVTDTTALKSNVSFQDVDNQFNYPLYLIILIGLAILSLILFVLFGGRIVKAWKLRKLAKEYRLFSERLTVYIRSLKQKPTQQLAETAITDWKMFMEKLEKRPYSRYTTKEILKMEATTELTQALKNIDRCIYGGKLETGLFKDFHSIEDFTQYRYQVTKEKIQRSKVSAIPKARDEEKEIEKIRFQAYNPEKEAILAELEQGGRYVLYYYTISILVVSFKRTKVVFLSGDDRGIVKGLKYSLISLLLGWWGIPWGIIYTIQSLYINFSGGKDITSEIVRKVNA